jgi:hypothetical protein
MLLTALAVGPLLLTGCAAETVPVPDVVGLPLDEAHRMLEKLGVEEFDDRDAFEDRSIVRDANWVVVASSPKAGDPVELDATVSFDVGKRDEQRAIEKLPADSPVAKEFAAAQDRRRRAEEKRQADAVAADAAADREHAAVLTDYINEIDPVIRLATNIYGEIDATAVGVRRKSYGNDQPMVVRKAVDAADLAHSRVAGLVPPQGSRRAGTHQDLVAAAQRWAEAASTLSSADGVGREASLARFAQVRAEAREAWNQAMTALYRGTAVAPPLLP